ncbi:cytochrome P450 90D2 [Amborella trichopoda]|nr:cytochrome P450 90D2 [Amborella trichopoda]|eukprot:XP_006838682.2 cytochrome P450 90D2 [Amborella trichopoda]
MVWVVLGAWFAVIFYSWWWWGTRRGPKNVPKGSLGWPFIGETLDFMSWGYTAKPEAFMEKRSSLYGKVFKTHVFGRATIVSTDAEVSKSVLQNDGRIFVPYYPKSLTMLMGDPSILLINGAPHRKLHALLSSFFKSPSLKAQVARDMEHHLHLSMPSWSQRCSPLRIQDQAKSMAFEILVRALMSVGSGKDMNFLRHEFREFIAGLMSLPFNLPGTRLRKSLQAKKRIMKLVRQIIEEKRKKRKQGLNPMDDVIDVLINDSQQDAQEEGNEIEMKDDLSMANTVIDMMIPGEDSVPVLITLALKFLTDNPTALQQMREENLKLKRLKAQAGEKLCWTDYMSLSFTQNVITETLRIGNIINAVMRKALKDVEIKGYLIPKGWCVLTSFRAVHLDEENFSNPYQFNPWRWKDKEAGGFTFTPFGGGYRLCPGIELSRLEAAVFLHHFVTSFSWVAEEDSIVNFPTVRMKCGLPLTLTPLPSYPSFPSQ